MSAIQDVLCAADPAIGFTKADISVSSLCAGQSIALLMAWVESNNIRLVGRWRSDMMIRYLYTTSKSFTEGLSVKIFQHGTYMFIPSAHYGN